RLRAGDPLLSARCADDAEAGFGEVLTQDLDVVRIIVDREDERRRRLAWRCSRFLGDRSSRCRTRRARTVAGGFGGSRNVAQRNDEGEGRSAIDLRSRGDVASEESREAPADRKSEPGASVLACRARVGLLELLEDSRQRLLADANAGVGDRDRELAFRGLRRDGDRSAMGEFRRVAKQIQHDLLDLLLVGMNESEARAKGLYERYPRLQKRRRRRHALVRELGGVEVARDDVHTASLD